MKNVTETQFDREVIRSKLPVVVDFYADWCPPCRAVSPLIDRLAQEYRDRVKVVKVDVQREPHLAQQFRILSIPTILFFKDGRPVDSVLGAQPIEVLQDHVEELI